jgi:putative DNA primase/helicase
MGKTQIALWIAAAVTTGGKWPDSDEHAVIGDVLILSTEDDVADTIKPRLEAAGADVSGVHVLQAVLEVSEDEIVERQFSLSRHIEEITGVLKSNPEIRLIVLDPLSAFLGVKDSHRDSDVREVLGPLAQLAAELCVTVIGIVHLNKTQSSDPMARFIGSTGIIASARSAYLVHGDDDE